MSGERLERPKVENAKSGRSKCRGCQENIIKDDPRIGIPFPFTTPKGEVITSYRYYHVNCTPRYEMQNVISFLTKEEDNADPDLRAQILASLNQLMEKKPSNELKSEQPVQNPLLEYAKSSRGRCKQCEEKIEKGTIRVAEPTLIELDDGRRFISNKYSHLDCYLDKAENPGDSIEALIKTSLEKKTIQSEQVPEIKQSYRYLSEKTTDLDKILDAIGSEPFELSKLRALANEKGVNYNLVEQAIDRALKRGEYFKPTPDTVQKLI